MTKYVNIIEDLFVMTNVELLTNLLKATRKIIYARCPQRALMFKSSLKSFATFNFILEFVHPLFNFHTWAYYY